MTQIETTDFPSYCSAADVARRLSSLVRDGSWEPTQISRADRLTSEEMMAAVRLSVVVQRLLA